MVVGGLAVGTRKGALRGSWPRPDVVVSPGLLVMSLDRRVKYTMRIGPEVEDQEAGERRK